MSRHPLHSSSRPAARRGFRSATTFAALVGAFVLIGLGDFRSAMAQGLGDLLVSPTRLVFEGRARSETVILSNQGASTQTYRIALINMVMEESGNLRNVDELPDDVKGATAMIRYAPRSVTIPPGGSQVVRVALRKPRGLENGEYRSHMLFRIVPPEDAGVSIAATPGSANINIQLIPVYGISIPVIVRHGDLSANSTFRDLKIERNENGLFLSGALTRDGGSSVFGDIIINYQRNGGGKLLIGELRRLAVYTPLPHRRFRVQLQLPDGVTLQGGQLSVAFMAPEGGVPPYATASLPVN